MPERLGLAHRSARAPALDAAVAALASGDPTVLTSQMPSMYAGFVVVAAQTITTEQMAMMLREVRGMPWLALPEERSRALGLKPPGSWPASRWNFMDSIDAARGITTGVAAAERALTMRIASDPATTERDIVRGGHVVPIGALSLDAPERPDVIEAAVQLVSLAGFPGGAAMCQILDERGEPAAAAAVTAFAVEHAFPVVDALDVLDLNMPARRLIVRSGEETVELGAHTVRAITYADRFYGVRHVALVSGEPAGDPGAVVRFHIQDPIRDAFAPSRRDELHRSLDLVASAPAGVLLYLTKTETPPGQERSELELALAARREPYVVAQILEDLGVDRLVADAQLAG